jgi:hypothetical protein
MEILDLLMCVIESPLKIKCDVAPFSMHVHYVEH